MLTENMKKTRAKKQMAKQRKLAAEAAREAEEKKRFVEKAKKDTASDTARLKRPRGFSLCANVNISRDSCSIDYSYGVQ